MTTDRAAGPWNRMTYNGFAGRQTSAAPAAPVATQAPARPRRGMVYGGVAAALAAGLLLGVATRPELGLGRKEAAPMRPVTRTLPVELAPAPTPAAAPASAARLEVLPPDMAAAAARSQVVAVAPPPALPPLAPRAAPVAPPVQSTPARPVDYDDAPAPAVTPSFNCRYARSASEQMVCSDPGLARMDRRLARAFENAVASGIPYRALRAEQDDWMQIREDAARHSPDAVASVYRQRIRELNQLADGG